MIRFLDNITLTALKIIKWILVLPFNFLFLNYMWQQNKRRRDFINSIKIPEPTGLKDHNRYFDLRTIKTGLLPPGMSIWEDRPQAIYEIKLDELALILKNNGWVELFPPSENHSHYPRGYFKLNADRLPKHEDFVDWIIEQGVLKLRDEYPRSMWPNRYTDFWLPYA